MFLAQWVRAAATAVVVAVPLVVTPWGQDAYSRPKALVLYALVAAMLAGWLVLAMVDRRRRWVVTSPELAVWLFVFALLVSSWTSVNARLTFFGAPGRYEGLFAIGAYVALYFAGAQFFGSHADLRRLALWTASAAVLVVVYGVLQSFLPPLFEGEAFTRTWYGGLGMIRIPSTVGGPVVFGGYLVFILPIFLVLAITERGPARVIWLAGSWLAVLALALTLTRAAWLAGAIGLTLLIAGVGRSVWRRQPALAASVPAALLLSAVFLVAVAGTPAQVASRMVTSVDPTSGSLAQHLFIWRRTIERIGERPLLGWGLETLREVFPYRREELVRYFGLRPTIIDRAHNDLLQVAVSVGVAGAIAYAAVWALIVVAAIRLRRRTTGEDRTLAAGWLAAVTAYLIQLQFSFSAVPVAPVVWLLAGAACGWEATGARSAADLPATGRTGPSTAVGHPG